MDEPPGPADRCCRCRAVLADRLPREPSAARCERCGYLTFFALPAERRSDVSAGIAIPGRR